MSDPNSQRPKPPAAGESGHATSSAAPLRPQSSAAKQPAGPASPTDADRNLPRRSGSGRVTHDERGNAIWEWVTTTTKNAILSATNLLKKLDSTELSLEETPPEDERAAQLPKHRPGGGFNPYEQANKPSGKK